MSQLDADVIVIATGSKAKVPPIPGIEKAMDAVTYLNGAEVGNKVVVIGGGQTGSEIAFDLHRKGKEPVIVEMMDDLMSIKNLCLANSSFLRDYFKANHVPVYLNTKTKEITDTEVVVVGKDSKEERIPYDNVVYSTGYTPTPIAKQSGNTYYVGDCNKVGNLRTVIWRAWDVAMKI